MSVIAHSRRPSLTGPHPRGEGFECRVGACADCTREVAASSDPTGRHGRADAQDSRGVKPLPHGRSGTVGRDRRIPPACANQAGSAIPPYSPRRRRGFTLLELLAVIAVIAILTGIVIGVGQSAAEKGKVARARAELAVLAAALESYKSVHGDYPRTSDSAYLLQALIGRRGPNLLPATGRALIETARHAVSADPLVDESALLLDPWEQPYRYAYKALPGWTNPAYVLGSAGPDKTGTATLLSGGFPDVTAPGNADNLYTGR